ncbi:hypothetical protein GmHk_05G012750 [Glycine max]|nr:hypothetical protein GmHk_05G012750 [Glycine max]
MKYGHAAEVPRPASETHRTHKRVQLRCDAVSVVAAIAGHSYMQETRLPKTKTVSARLLLAASEPPLLLTASISPFAEMNASSPSQAKEQDDDTKPLWTYVTKIKSVSGGGNYEIKYNICDFTFNGPYTRVRAHLLKMTGKGVRVCQKVTIDRLIDLKKIDNDATLRVEKSKTKSMSLPPVST